MRAEGKTYREIGDTLGVSIQAAHEWCSDPDGTKRDARRAGYAGTCIDCGAPTDGSDGPGKASQRCSACVTWTREAVILAFQTYFEEHGEPPRSHTRGMPESVTVRRRFGSWAAGLEAAGLPVVCDRRPETWASVVERAQRGEAVADIAEDMGCTVSNIYQHLARRGVRLRWYPEFTAEDRQRAVDAYLAGASLRRTAEIVGTTATTVTRWLDQAGVARRHAGWTRSAA